MKDHPIPSDFANWPNPRARDLLERAVCEELSAYQDRQASRQDLVFLDLEDLKAAIDSGRADFGARELEPAKINAALAIRAAIEAFEDGVVMMFVDGARIDNLDLRLYLSKTSKVRYIRLTSLRGC